MSEWVLPLDFRIERTWDRAERLLPHAVKRVLMVGDIHDDVGHLDAALERAVDLDVDVVVQVGDFRVSDERRYFDAEAAFMWEATDAPMPVIVVDGSPSAWRSIRDFATTPEAQAAVAAMRPLHLGGSLWWAWRGSVWRWGKASCGVLGGARSPHRGWFDTAKAFADLDLLIINAQSRTHGRLDIMFAHDAPTPAERSAGDAQPPVDEHLLSAVNLLKVRLLVHRNWRRATREHITPRTEAVGLSADGRPHSTAVLTLSDPPQVEYQW